LGALDPYYTALESPRHSLHILNWLRSRRKNVPFDWLRDFKPVHLTYKPAATEVFLRNMNSAHALLTGQSIEFRLWLQPTIRVPQRTLDVQEQGMIGDFYLPALDQAYGELARECSARLPASWFRGFLSISRHRGQMFIDNVHFSEDGAREVAREIYSDIYDPIRISRIEMAREQNAILLGRGWRAPTNGLRWISDEATVEMSCPASGGGARLLLNGQSGPRPIELQVYAGDRVLYKQRMPADQAVKIGLPVESSLCASPFEVRLRALSGEAGQPALGVRSLEVQSLESH